MSHVHSNDEAEQIMLDLKALTEGMSPDEIRGSFACVLSSANDHGVKTANVDLVVVTATLAQLANVLFAETKVDHGGCAALTALTERMQRVNGR